MEKKSKAEHYIEDVIGCGQFQVVLFLFLVMAVRASCAFSVTFMAFGNYNPGWRCLDNETHSSSNWTTKFVGDIILAKNQSLEYEVGSCEAYKQCRQVEFNPESSTIVTEWRLVCDDSWKISLTISLQMVGMLLGSFVGGQMSDLVGRKKTLYFCVAFGAILQLLSFLSVSWEMFTVLRFFNGFFAVTVINLGILYMSEMMTKNWRASSLSIPDWQLGAVTMAFSAMFLKNWRHVELVGCIMYVASFVPVFWAPESLRWLEVKNKTGEFYSTAKKMAAMNKRVITELEDNVSAGIVSKTTKDTKNYTVVDIFRKGYRFITCSFSFMYFTSSVLYFVLTFGVKSLYGDFYVNLIIFPIVEVPFCVLTMLTLRYLSRVTNSVLFLASFIVCVLTTAGMTFSQSESVRAFGCTILVAAARALLNSVWLALTIRATELYPTVVRGISLGWISLMARLGGILAPFLIPKDPSSLYIYMISMGVVALVLCAINVKLPETEGKPLKETFETFEERDAKNINIVDDDTMGSL